MPLQIYYTPFLPFVYKKFCLRIGFDVKSLSEILGHASVNITMNRYVHPTLELKKENMQRLSSLLAVN